MFVFLTVSKEAYLRALSREFWSNPGEVLFKYEQATIGAKALSLFVLGVKKKEKAPLGPNAGRTTGPPDL